MKKILILILIVIVVFYTWGRITGNSYYFGQKTFANHTLQGATVFGPLLATKMTITRLTVHGPAEIDSTTIEEFLSVKGPLSIYNSRIEGSLECEGTVDITDSTVNGFAVIQGTLNASDTTFNSFISITSNKIKLSGVTVDGNITINDHKAEQVLELNHGTVVKGSVMFKSGKGIIVKGEDSKIEGKIEGVEIKKL